MKFDETGFPPCCKYKLWSNPNDWEKLPATIWSNPNDWERLPATIWSNPNDWERSPATIWSNPNDWERLPRQFGVIPMIGNGTLQRFASFTR